jgi:2-oxoglutarate ferredoxin oxidoreductase subunit gamma
LSEIREDILIAGFGGQGVMLAGKLLAYASMTEGKNVTWLPSYGPEMRGGTANCMVVISTHRIASPYVTKPSSLIVMNNPSLYAFECLVKPGGLILLNSSMINRELTRKDLTVYKIPATETADKLGDIRVANMVILGAFIRVRPIVRIDSVLGALEKVLTVRHKNLLNLNKIALKKGFEMAGLCK